MGWLPLQPSDRHGPAQPSALQESFAPLLKGWDPEHCSPKPPLLPGTFLFDSELSFPLSAADFLVSCCLEAYQAAKAARTKLVAWQQLLQRALLRCSMHAARSGLVLAAVALGEFAGCVWVGVLGGGGGGGGFRLLSSQLPA